MRPARAARQASGNARGWRADGPTRGAGPARVRSSPALRTTKSACVMPLPRALDEWRLLPFFAALEEAQVVLDLGFLLQVQDLIQPGDEGAQVGAQPAAVGPQVEDGALLLVGALLCQVQQTVGLQFRFLDDALPFLARVLLDLFGDALSGEQRVLEDRLALAVLLDQGAQRQQLAL